MGLLRFLFITIIVIYIIRILARLFMPFLFRKAAEKMTEKMNNQSGQQQANYQSSNKKPEGTISVDYVPPKEKKKPKLDNAGDFVDYEDLK
nr:DUF4834 family protein [Pseudopedobacter sp.]